MNGSITESTEAYSVPRVSLTLPPTTLPLDYRTERQSAALRRKLQSVNANACNSWIVPADIQLRTTDVYGCWLGYFEKGFGSEDLRTERARIKEALVAVQRWPQGTVVLYKSHEMRIAYIRPVYSAVAMRELQRRDYETWWEIDVSVSQRETPVPTLQRYYYFAYLVPISPNHMLESVKAVSVYELGLGPEYVPA